MKKVFFTTIAALLVVNAAQASNDTHDLCDHLSFHGMGSKYESPQDHYDASLWYNSANGDGVSGGFAALVHGYYVNSTLIDSHCHLGHISLKMNGKNLKGYLEGDLVSFGTEIYITHVTGNIDNMPVSSDLKFIGHIIKS